MAKAEQQKEGQEWETRIADYKASGQSVREWCAANGIRPGRLWYHLRRERCHARAGAIVYSIVETAKENGLIPFEYLR